MRKALTLTLIGIIGFSNLVFAETVILKTGEKMEGKILERTDRYIRLKFCGVPLTWYVDEIESIDGASVSYEEAPKKKEAKRNDTENIIDTYTTPVEKMVNTGWEEWFIRASSHVGRIDAIGKKNEKIKRRSLKKIKRMLKADDRTYEKEILAETDANLSALIAELKTLDSPDELTAYKKEMINSVRYWKKVYRAIAEKDKRNSSAYEWLALTSAMNRSASLKSLYEEKGVPAEIVSALDGEIAIYKKRLNKIAMEMDFPAPRDKEDI